MEVNALVSGHRSSHSEVESLEALLREVERQVASDPGELMETFGSTYCLEVSDLPDAPLHVLYRLADGDPETFDLQAAYLDGVRLEGQAEQLAAVIGRAVVNSEAMEEFLFG